MESGVFSCLYFKLRNFWSLFDSFCSLLWYAATTFQWKEAEEVEESTNPLGYVSVFAEFKQFQQFDIF